MLSMAIRAYHATEYVCRVLAAAAAWREEGDERAGIWRADKMARA
jgi:hypothetical protein